MREATAAPQDAKWAGPASPEALDYASRAKTLEFVQTIYSRHDGEVQRVLSFIDTDEPSDEYRLYEVQGEIIAAHLDERLLFETTNLHRFTPGESPVEPLESGAVLIYRRVW